MTLESTARAALETIQTTLAPTANVTLEYETYSATGTRAVRESDSAPDEMGPMGDYVNTVRVSAAAFPHLPLLAPFKVDGAKCICRDCQTDPVGAMRLISYTETKPITGVT